MANRKPAWWQLFLFPPVMFALMALAHLAHFGSVLEEGADLGTVLLTFVGMAVWVQANGGALERYYMERDRSNQNLRITVYDPPLERKRNRARSHAPIGYGLPHNSMPVDVEPGTESPEEESDKWLPN